MAESSDPDSQAAAAAGLVESDPPESEPGERDARDATELARLRRNYSRASTLQRQASTIPVKPTGHLERFMHLVKKFWGHQISITVAHKECRDHLGAKSLSFLAMILRFKHFDLALI